MTRLGELRTSDAFAPNCALIGEGHLADRIWTKPQFLELCSLMHNGNPSKSDFLLAYRDDQGQAKFARAKRVEMLRRASWAWETIGGKSKHKVGIGFYPANRESQTRWGAMDFDAHDGQAERARRFAIAAIDVLRRFRRDIDVILTTSGSAGWHVFALTEQLFAVSDWTLLLKQVAAAISATIRPGECEIFPNEVREGTWPYGIRAPGTWNPKTDESGRIFFETVGPQIKSRAERKKENKKSTFLYHSSHHALTLQLNDTGTGFYRGEQGCWQREFAITAPSSRHAQLERLVYAVYRQVSKEVARSNAELQHHSANPQSRATLAQHLEEFEELWRWTEKEWLRNLSTEERQRFGELRLVTERDVFRILKNFAQYARLKNETDFPVSVDHLARRLGFSFQYGSKLRARFVDLGIIAETRLHVANRAAARYRWCLQVMMFGSTRPAQPMASGRM